MNAITPVGEMSNQDFLRKYASAGRVGLVCGSFRVDKLIRRAQRHVNEGKEWGLWSHALVFQGERADGHHWVLESDLDVHHKHIRLGAQENRISKYFDEKDFPHLAVLDFGLSAEQTRGVVSHGLEMIAGRMRYSLRELVGTLVALRFPGAGPRRTASRRRTRSTAPPSYSTSSRRAAWSWCRRSRSSATPRRISSAPRSPTPPGSCSAPSRPDSVSPITARLRG